MTIVIREKVAAPVVVRMLRRQLVVSSRSSLELLAIPFKFLDEILDFGSGCWGVFDGSKHLHPPSNVSMARLIPLPGLIFFSIKNK